MPAIKMYRTTTEKREAMGDELVSASELTQWLKNEDRVKEFPGESDHLFNYRHFVGTTPDHTYEWRPNFPAGYVMYSTTIPDEALMSSNYDAIVETFNDNGLGDLISGSCSTGTFDIYGDDPHTFNALALACRLDEMAENYPVLDEELMSEREMEYTERDFESYGRDEAISALAENGSSLIGENGELLQEFTDTVEQYLYRLADSAVAYCGELYFGYSSEYGESWDELKYALGEILQGWGYATPMPELIEGFDRMVRNDKAEQDRKQFEEFQPPLEQ